MLIPSTENTIHNSDRVPQPVSSNCGENSKAEEQHKSGANGLSRRMRKAKSVELFSDSSTQSDASALGTSSTGSRGGIGNKDGKIRKPKKTRRMRKKQSNDDGGNNVQKKQEDTKANSSNMVCFVCHVTQSPMWRKGGDDGNKILCNRCGLFWKRHHGYRPLCVKKGKRSHLYEYNFKKRPGRRYIKDKGSTNTDAELKISDAVMSSTAPSPVHDDDGQQQQQQSLSSALVESREQNRKK